MKKIANSKLFIVSVILILISATFLVIQIKIGNSGAYHLDGSYTESGNPALYLSGLIGIFFSVPLFCAFLALIVTLFIKNGKKYNENYLRCFLIIMLILYTITSLRFIYNVIMLLN